MFRFLQCFNTCILLQDELRKELEMDEELPAVLLMGGGEGMGPVETTARALGEALYDANTGKPIGQLVVVCGRNKNLVRKLQQVNWKIPIQVQGFVTNMSEWMAACDCIITKVSSLSQLLLLVFIRLVLVFFAWHKLQKLEDTSLGLHPALNQDVSQPIQDSPLFPAKFHNLQSAWSLQSQSLQTQIPA
jgi:hypothetical protein